MQTPATSEATVAKPARSGRRVLRIAMLVAILVAAVLLRDHISPQALVANHAALMEWREANPLLTLIVFFAASVTIAAISLPGVIMLKLIAGYLFGLLYGTLIAALAATIGATILFLAVRAGFGESLLARYRDRMGHGLIGRVCAGFRDNELRALFLLRLLPPIPFVVSNALPALLGARPRNFVFTTLIGILPSALVFTAIGTGLGDVLSAGQLPALGGQTFFLLTIPLVIAVITIAMQRREMRAGRGDAAIPADRAIPRHTAPMHGGSPFLGV